VVGIRLPESLTIRYKAPVGLRLSLAAQALAYGSKVPYQNPAIRAIQPIEITAAGPGKLRLTFDVAVEVIPPVRGPCPVAPTSCAWLSINGANATDYSAVNGSVVVTVPAAAAAAAPRGDAVLVDYLQGDWPVPFIYAQGVPGYPGLPAAPFSDVVPPISVFDE